MPAIRSSSASVPVTIAKPASAPPKAIEPVSPMKSSAGKALYQRNPIAAPISAAARIARSSRKAVRGPDVTRPDVADHVDREEREQSDDPDPRREPVEAVGQVGAVRRAGDDEEEEGVVGVRERDVDVHDRDVDRGVELALRVDGEADHDRDRGEQEQLPPALEPERAAVPHLDEVVEKADRGARDRQEEDGQRGQRELREREEREDGAEQDQQAAHHRAFPA